MLKNPLASVNDRTEALTLRARNAKVTARSLFTGKEPTTRILSALRAGLFRRARDLYAAAFSENLNHFYSGLNALSLTVLLLHLIEHQRDTWLNMFEREDEAGRDENLWHAARSLRTVRVHAPPHNAAQGSEVSRGHILQDLLLQR